MSQIINNPIALPYGVLQVMGVTQERDGQIELLLKYSSYDDLENPEYISQTIKPVYEDPQRIRSEGQSFHRHSTVTLKDQL